MLFSFDHLEGSFLRSLSFIFTSVTPSVYGLQCTLQYNTNGVLCHLEYIFSFQLFLNHPGNFVSEGEVSAVKLALKSPSLPERLFLLLFLFTLAGCWMALKCF